MESKKNSLRAKDLNAVEQHVFKIREVQKKKNIFYTKLQILFRLKISTISKANGSSFTHGLCH